MRLWRRMTAVLLIAVLAVPTLAFAQQSQAERPAASSTPAQSSTAASQVNLPVSLERIRRELIHQAARSRNDSRGLDIRYYVEVYGRAPRIEIFTKDMDLVHGPVPYGGMTHQEFLNLVTPQEFRAPAADLTMLPILLGKWLADRGKKKDDSQKP